MVQNNIKGETELFSIADEQKKAGKKDFAGQEDGGGRGRGLQAKTFFTQKKPAWKGFMSIPMRDVKTPI